MIYFAKAVTSGNIKIGFTRSPAKRLSQLQANLDQDVEMLATMPGGFTLEASLHAKFIASRISGEWFKPTEDLVNYIKTAATSYNDKTALAEDRFSIGDVLPYKVKNQLILLGERIKLARFRRKLTSEMVAERAAISRPTYRAIEQGNTGVAIGKYASVLFVLGLHDCLDLIAEKDELGRLLQDSSLGQRVRP